MGSNAESSAAAGKLLALDIGFARIGVAVCDPLQLAARPLEVLHRRSRNEDFHLLAKIVQREGVRAIVCGLPLAMDGDEKTQAQTVRKWAMRLAYALRALLGTPLPVIFWDERLSTYAAQAIMLDRKLNVGEDAVAAAVILQSYLDAKHSGDRQEYGRIDLPLAMPQD